MYGLRIITPPTIEPVTLPELRAQTRVDEVGDDPTLAGYIIAARQYVEQVTGRAIMTQTLEMTLDDFPACGEIQLPRAPVSSITSIAYTDANGNAQTVASYILDATQFVARLTPAYGATWPATRGTPGNVKITFVAGEAQPPWPIKQAILLLAADWHRNRESPPENPAVDRLIAPFRLHWI